ncbi:hypothetical protein TWF281_004369 [Arthrobotrys megalospora]
MSGQETIHEAAIASRENLRRCLDESRLTWNGWAENRLLDFNLWCAGAGVFGDGKLSFDYRLAPKPEIRSSIIGLLHLLDIFIEACIEKAQAFSLDEKGLGSEGQQQNPHYLGEEHPCDVGLSSGEVQGRKNVELILNQIITLTVAIRSAGSRSRFRRADRSFNPGDPQMESLRRSLEFFIHPRVEKDNWVADAIQLRLIDANLQRRHRFNYAKAHSINLAGPRPERQPKTVVETTTRQIPQDPIIGASADLPSEKLSRPMASAPSVIAPTIVTAASTIEGTVAIKAKQTRRALSVTTHSIDYPLPPQHLAGDILPYTCVLPDCAQPLQLFSTRKDWERHLNMEHGQYWNCFVCEELGTSEDHEFRDEASISHHLQTIHGEAISAGEVPILIDASHYSKLPEKIPCPLCSGPQAGDDPLNHLAQCIHEFSLRSLPSPPESYGPGSYFGDGVEGQGTISRNIASRSVYSDRDTEGLSEVDYEQSSSPSPNFGYRGPTESLLKELSQSLPQTLDASVRRWMGDFSDGENVEITSESLDAPGEISSLLTGLAPRDFAADLAEVLCERLANHLATSKLVEMHIDEYLTRMPPPGLDPGTLAGERLETIIARYIINLEFDLIGYLDEAFDELVSHTD